MIGWSEGWHVVQSVAIIAHPSFCNVRYATTLVMKLAYGHQILSDDDEYIKIGENFSNAFGKSGSPGTTPPDFMPFCAFSATF
jgi:hypothetical protein